LGRINLSRQRSRRLFHLSEATRLGVFWLLFGSILGSMGCIMKFPLSRVLLVLIAVIGLCLVLLAGENRKSRILIAGDSTAQPGSMRHQIYGWGDPFTDLFDSNKVKVTNLARGGRSSRTFITEGLWDILLEKVRPGDVVLIQFGHNDSGELNEEPEGSTRPLRARGSLPGIGEETVTIDNVLTGKHELVHSYGWYLRKMIADVQARGGRPILLSPTVQNRWTEHRKIVRYNPYRGWTREVAAAEGVPFVDLARILADDYQAQGREVVGQFFSRDTIHTNTRGAAHTAALVLSGLKGLRGEAAIPELDSLLSEKGRAVEVDRIGWLDLPESANPQLPSLFLIGDSTVRNGRGDGSNGEWGWGDALGAHFDSETINIVNRAVGGLSSRTFLTQGHWERVLHLLKPGDFVLIQFGHNDSGPINDDSRARGTLRSTGEEVEEILNLLTGQRETVHSYGWYLRHYIREARAQGAVPILCSPVPRKIWEGGKVVRNQGGYARLAATVAREEGVAFIDLGELVAARYDALGAEAVDALFADARTHTSRAGAEISAQVVAHALGELGD